VLGWDRSVEVVTAAMRRLGLDEAAASTADCRVILEDLALEPGLVGVSARYALSRTSRSDVPPATAPPSPPRVTPSVPPPDSASARLAQTMAVHELVAQLAPLLGDDRSASVVEGLLKRLGLPRERLDRAELTRLLDELARQGGHLGSTGRFVRPRILAKLG
jgi:hypothetical protein